MLKKINPLAIWVILFAIASTVLLQSDFRSSSNDSKFYTYLVGQLYQQPAAQWIAPKWGDNYWGHPPDMYIRDHLVGNIIGGVILARMGLNENHALHVLQMLYQVLSLLLLYSIAAQFMAKSQASTLMWTLLLIPVAFTYSIRANHEQGMMFFNLLAVYSSVRLVGSGGWFVGVVIGAIGTFLIKGFPFVLVIPMCLVAFYIAYIHKHSCGFKKLIANREVIYKSIGMGVLPLMGVVLVAYIYEQLYTRATGLEFFSEYWRVQIMERSVEIAAKHSFIVQKLSNFKYYVLRTIYYSAPWSLAVIGVLIAQRKKLNSVVVSPTFLLFLCTGLVYIFAFSVFDRTASRYIFPTFYLFSAAMVVFLWENSPRFRKIHRKIETQGAFQVAAWIWFVSIVGHLLVKA